MRASKSLTVLLVEDNGLVREDLASEFRLERWTVLEAATGARAIEWLHEITSIDLIVTDIRLADAMTGWEVAEVARELYATIAVVYTSGASTRGDRQVAKSIFLAKPVTPPEVMLACRGLVAGAR